MKPGDRVRFHPKLHADERRDSERKLVGTDVIGTVIAVFPSLARAPLVEVQFGQSTLPLRYASDFQPYVAPISSEA